MQPYTLTRRRMRYVRMRVSADGRLLVSAPHGAPLSEINKFVASREGWIARTRAKLIERPAPLTRGPEADALRPVLNRELAWLIPYWADRIGVDQPAVTLRVMTSRWGSCRRDPARITLNLELGRRSFELLEYVVVHELVHLIEANHGPGFYAYMTMYLPEWKLLRAQLNKPPAPSEVPLSAEW